MSWLGLMELTIHRSCRTNNTRSLARPLHRHVMLFHHLLRHIVSELWADEPVEEMTSGLQLRNGFLHIAVS